MREPGCFEILARDSGSQARRGRLWTAHGAVETPVFMPVGTQATVKALCSGEMRELGVEAILANTYHLMGRPGTDVVAACGGLHRFMDWPGTIVTDSGGFQVFSLSRLRKVRDDGVEFSSHLDGTRVFLGPVEAMGVQRVLGSDIAMVLDECAPYPCERDYACQVVDKTIAWATLCSQQPRAAGQLVFGIVQGSDYADLRGACARGLTKIGFDGYAIGGVSVGEPDGVLRRGVEHSVAELPTDRPRYLMGVGRIDQMVDAIASGVDMFDCVMPTRMARNGTAFTMSGRYPVKGGSYRADTRPVEVGCECYCCRRYTRAYVRHLLNVGEIVGVRLLTMHNVHVYMRTMAQIRAAIEGGTFGAYREKLLSESCFAKSRRPE